MNASRKEDNISVVTAKLFGLILKMPLEDRRRLLSQVERGNQSGENAARRNHERQDYLISIDYTVKNQFYNGFIVNLSAGGVFIESPKTILPKFSPGDHVILSFDHPNKQEHMKINGEIVRVNGDGLGVKFSQLLLDWWTT